MTKFIAIISGKGGAGKTTTTLNLGHAISELGKKVVLLDANLTTPNLAIQLGLMNPEGTLNKYLRKDKSLKEIDDSEYIRVLISLLTGKEASIKAEDPYQKKDKVSKYAIAKGFEPELVWELLKKI